MKNRIVVYILVFWLFAGGLIAAGQLLQVGVPRADMNCNGAADVGDVLFIAQFVAGLRSAPSTCVDNAQAMVEQGRQIFRFDTFGDEAFWGDTLQLHQAIAGVANGGVGPGVSPSTALAVGLKVDVEKLPAPVVQALANGTVNLSDPATTLTLLQLDAVVGVKGTFNATNITSIGITCALCHSTVDDSFAPGIGKRLDGWPNRDLNVGVIVSLAPNLTALATRLHTNVTTVQAVLQSWGPGRYDAELNMDGKAFNPLNNNSSGATLLPAAFGLAGVNLHTYAGWGSVTYWNAYVAVTQMHGKGRFYDPRMNNTAKFPLAVETGDWNITNDPDLVSSKLPALHFYQLALPAPTPPAGSFDPVAAARGNVTFSGKAGCVRCHVPPTFTEPGWPMHNASEIGIDDFQANRSPDGKYRTTPLKGLFTRTKGGFYHDGRFANLTEVVNHYDGFFVLGLTPAEKADLVEFLKSL